MSQKKDKRMRKVAKDMADKLIPQMANNTNEVIVQMQEHWPKEDKIQFCKWFLGIKSDEELAEELDFELDNPDQLEFDFEGDSDGTDTRGESQGQSKEAS